MTRMTGPDCAVMRNLINIHTHTQSKLVYAGYVHNLNCLKMARYFSKQEGEVGQNNQAEMQQVRRLVTVQF